MASEFDFEVLIVGAGLAGLACARQLQQAGKSFAVLEAADAVGGRVRTDRVEGFLLDRGFQVLLSSYPEPKRWLNLDDLQVRSFTDGARIRYRGRFYDLADPWRRPWHAIGSLFNPIGSVLDKLRVARLRSLSLKGSYQDRLQDPQCTTLDYLLRLGFSSQMIDVFFRPFLGGIFLDADLQTTSRMLNFVFRMFATGQACLPAAGMQALPDLLASALPAQSVRLSCSVAKVEPHRVTLQTGETLTARAVVLATDGPTAAALSSHRIPVLNSSGRGVRCLYYDAPFAPFDEPMLVLNGEPSGPINNLCVPTNIAPTYGPAGQSLVSVTVLDHREHATSALTDDDLELAVRAQLRQWYGGQTDQWRHLRTYTVCYALPDQTTPALEPPERAVKLADGLYLCGDHRDNASIEGALVSGRRAAEAFLASSS